MNKSNELSKKLEDLKVKTSRLFNELTANGAEYNFTEGHGSDEPTVKERFRDLRLIGNEDVLPIIEVRNDINGEVSDVYVAYVSSKEIIFFNMNDGLQMNGYGWNHIGGVEDQLVLLNEMYEYEF